MKTLRIVFCFISLCIVYSGCDGLDLQQGASSLSRLGTVPESEVTTLSYATIENRMYVHVELPDTLADAHTILVCAYDQEHEHVCCSQWVFENIDQFWVPYADVENCAVRITCWGRFGMRYITGVW